MAEDGGPGLMLSAMRVESSNGFVLTGLFGEYGRIHGKVPMSLGESPEHYNERVDYWTELNLQTVYRADSILALQGGTDEGASLGVRSFVYRFASPEDAERYAMNGARRFVDDVGEFYTAGEELDELPAFGGAVTGVSFAFPLDANATSSGYIYWVQVGADVVVVQADMDGGVTQEGVITLVRAQIDCLDSVTEQCAPVPVPEGLIE